MTKEERSLAEKLRRQAEEKVRVAREGPGDLLAIFILAPIVSLFLGLTSYQLFRVTFEPLRMLATVIVVAVAGVGLMRLRARMRASAALQLLEDDLTNGDVEVVSVETARILKPGDTVHRTSGTYLADLGGDEFLVVGRPYEPTARSETIFPCRRFEVVRLPNDRTAILLEPVGDPIAPVPLGRDVGPVEEGAVLRLDGVAPA